MRYDDVWRLQDEITSAVNALGNTVWELKYDLHSETFSLELNDHLDDDIASSFCSQMPLTTDYDGEGNNGSIFTLYI